MSKQQENQGFIDELMSFDPSQVAAFSEPEQQKLTNVNLYKTNPLKVDSKISPDGHYHAKIRIIYNPNNMRESIVNNAHYAMSDANGFFMIDSKLAMGDRNCFMFKAWKQLHFSEDTTTFNVDGKQYTKKEWGDHMFDKSEERFCLVQVIEDQNQPEMVGKFKAWRLPKAIYDMLQAKMNPTDKSKAPQDLMNYLFGPVLELDVTPGPDDPQHPERKQREIKYNLCSFEADPTPIVTVTGESLFTDEEMDMIMDYAESKKVITNPKSTAKKKDEATAKCKELVEPLKALMQKAMDYVKENAIDLVEEFGYHEPTPEQRKRAEEWIDIVVNKLKNPQTWGDATSAIPAETPSQENVEEAVANPADDLPF